MVNEPCFGTQSGKIVDWLEKVSFWKMIPLLNDVFLCLLWSVQNVIA